MKHKVHAMKVSVYLFPLNSRESPRLLWLLTAASSSDVLGGSFLWLLTAASSSDVLGGSSVVVVGGLSCMVGV